MTITETNDSEINNTHSVQEKVMIRQAATGQDAVVLSDIYNEENNIVIWQRDISEELDGSVNHFIQANPSFQIAKIVESNTIHNDINDVIGDIAEKALCNDIAELTDMFCCLFETNRVGLRLTVLNQAMCPKFHVDRVPARLVTTYQGVATEWLPHQSVDRSKLGTGGQGKADHESGLFNSTQDIQQLSRGDVALLKGELWQGNEGAGLVHRSPSVENNQSRLLLTLDFVN